MHQCNGNKSVIEQFINQYWILLVIIAIKFTLQFTLVNPVYYTATSFCISTRPITWLSDIFPFRHLLRWFQKLFFCWVAVFSGYASSLPFLAH